MTIDTEVSHDEACILDDGCPTEMAVLQREWRRLRAEVSMLRQEGGPAIDALRIAPRAISGEADFDELTWTFKIAPDCRIGAGVYALVWMGPNVQGQG